MVVPGRIFPGGVGRRQGERYGDDPRTEKASPGCIQTSVGDMSSLQMGLIKIGGHEGGDPEIPMLQRVRDILGGRHINIVHRLDQGASGALLMDFDRPVEILSEVLHHVIVSKPPGVVCHHIPWTGRRGDYCRVQEPTPMLNQVRDATKGRRVNLLHCLDRYVSRCLILSFAADDEDDDVDNGSAYIDTGGERRRSKKGPTATLIGAM